ITKKKLHAPAANNSQVSKSSNAHTLTETPKTQKSPEAKNPTIAKEQCDSYNITETYTGKHHHMTAELTK
ncbi:hypothetical protein, partial [Klebsiella variicola]|uniref:hypothetical protein n=1 Tax=Klebsiella variicola TaxID=244366 RepID=UPI0039C36992